MAVRVATAATAVWAADAAAGQVGVAALSIGMLGAQPPRREESYRGHRRVSH